MGEQQWKQASKSLMMLIRQRHRYFGPQARDDGSVVMETLLSACEGWSREHVIHIVHTSFKHGQPRFELLTDVGEERVRERTNTWYQLNAHQKSEKSIEQHIYNLT